MIKVVDIVDELIKKDEVALEAMRAGLLNFSAYANKILPEVEKITLKDVQKGTIVVALSRIAKNSKKATSPLKPEIKIENIEIKTSLACVTFEKTDDIRRKVSTLNPFQISSNDLFAVSEGPTEVTLIFSDRCTDKINKHFNTQPKIEYKDLAAITVRFNEKLADITNLQYVLFSALAAKRINIIETVSTHTEISFIVKREEMEETIKTLNFYFKKIS